MIVYTDQEGGDGSCPAARHQVGVRGIRRGDPAQPDPRTEVQEASVLTQVSLGPKSACPYVGGLSIQCIFLYLSQASRSYSHI